ncbi:MAG: hypothetical protein IKV43_02650, partial [Clostridia bacterium]|nr:hypothetical protein [Clostridia bacterium]
MLKLIEGGFQSGAHGHLVDLIKKSVEANKKCFLFVPEQQTLSAEAEMCETLPSYAPRFFEVTNFTRFANTAFRELGGIGGKYCTGAESSLIMWRVLSELKDKQSCDQRLVAYGFGDGGGGPTFGMLEYLKRVKGL